MDSFRALIHFLRKHNHHVETDTSGGVNMAYFTGSGVRGAFGKPGFPSSYLDGRIAVDNIKCFNKYSQCPLIDHIPQNDSERRRLLGHLKFLRTEKARRWSTTFGFYDDPILPRRPKEYP